LSSLSTYSTLSNGNLNSTSTSILGLEMVIQHAELLLLLSCCLAAAAAELLLLSCCC
jgi:hypothetical protein